MMERKATVAELGNSPAPSGTLYLGPTNRGNYQSDYRDSPPQQGTPVTNEIDAILPPPRLSG